MFLKKSSCDEFIDNLEQNIKSINQQPLINNGITRKKAIEHLLIAADILDDVGLVKEANKITLLLEKFSQEDINEIDNDGDIIDVVIPNDNELVDMQPDGELKEVIIE